MSTEKTLNTRIILRNDTLEHWNGESSIALRAGEIGLAKVTTWKKDSVTNDMIPVPTYLMKVGDGTTAFKDLNWLAAPASDVHAWAKATEKPTYTGAEIKVSDATGAQTVSDAIAALEGAVGTGGSVSQQIADAIDTALAELKHTDTETGTFVTAVTQANGVITISRRNLEATDIPALGIDKITDLQTALDAKAPLSDFNTLKGTVGDSSGGLVKGLADEVNARVQGDEALGERIDDLTDAIKNVSNIMNFIGVAEINTTNTTLEAAAAALYDQGKTAEKGDVIICGEKEYVYSGSAWVEFGDASGNANAIADLDDRVTVAEGKIATLEEASSEHATTAYVDEELAKKLDVSTFNAHVTDVTDVIDPLVSTVGDETDGLVKDVADLKTAVGNNTGAALTERVEALEAASATHATTTALAAQKDRIDAIETRFGVAGDVLIFDCGTATSAY